MKVLVSSNEKAFRLLNVRTECIEAFRPCVVTVSETIETMVMQRKLTVLSPPLADSVMDSDFKKFYKECHPDLELAIQSFLASAQTMDNLDRRSEEDLDAAADAAAAAQREADDKARAAAAAEAQAAADAAAKAEAEAKAKAEAEAKNKAAIAAAATAALAPPPAAAAAIAKEVK